MIKGSIQAFPCFNNQYMIKNLLDKIRSNIRRHTEALMFEQRISIQKRASTFFQKPTHGNEKSVQLGRQKTSV